MTQIGVVIPAYRCERFLAQAIESVQAQDPAQWRLVVVDDGSPDRAADIAQTYVADDPRIELIRQPNRGVSDARNTGAARLGEADALLFLDADDVLLPNALADLGHTLEQHPEAPAVFGFADYIDADGITSHGSELSSGQRARVGTSVSFLELAVDSFIGPPAAVLVRTQAFVAVGRWDTRFSYAADWDLLLRLARLGDLVPAVATTVHYRRHDTNMTVVGNAAGYDELRQVRFVTYGSDRNTGEQRQALRQVWRSHHLAWAATRWRAGVKTREVPAIVAHLGCAVIGPVDLTRRPWRNRGHYAERSPRQN